MKISENGLKLIAKFEGFRACPYLDAVGVPTIGYGNTFYPNGKKVTMDDPKITKEKALELLKYVADDFAKQVDKVVVRELNQNQFDALVSFAYNLGIGNLRRSTLLEKVNRNPCDPSIPDEFRKWVYAGGERLKGLERRRDEEAKLYVK